MSLQPSSHEIRDGLLVSGDISAVLNGGQALSQDPLSFFFRALDCFAYKPAFAGGIGRHVVPELPGAFLPLPYATLHPFPAGTVPALPAGLYCISN